MVKGIIGAIGSGFAGLCCAGFPLLLAFLGGIGLGFLINDFILFPILFIFLGISFYALHHNKKKHLSKNPIYLALLGALFIIIGIFFRPLSWIGIIALVTASTWDYVLIRKCKTCEVKKT